MMYLWMLLTIATFGWSNNTENESDQQPPNILWVSVEDITPMLGCYGDVNANTPHLDTFAKNSVRFTNAFATSPVCSPSRSTIITGYYAATLGTQHLRSDIKLPDRIIPFPKYLREIGYYTSNNVKEDYNFKDTTIWDESSYKAHWRNRKEDQPFFSVFNYVITHQSGIFGNDEVYEDRIAEFLPFIECSPPENIVLPPYYPDSPEIRKLWARYYTNVSIADYQFSEVLKQLEEDGLMENTIVFFFSDHGTGVPRGKRALYDSGLKVPLLVHIPEKYADEFEFKPGSVDNHPVSFVDFAPTILKICGIDIPPEWPGRPFISREETEEKPFVFGMSDRVDEAYEMARTIRTKKYRYIRNFMPHLPLLQPNFYTDQSEIMKELSRLRNKGGLNKAQSTMFVTKRLPEELYDVENDPYEVHNLAYDLDYKALVMEMRDSLKNKMKEIYDTGLMPEPEMLRLSAHTTPMELARNTEIFPIDEILDACDLMLESGLSSKTAVEFLNHTNGFVRYWTVITVESADQPGKSVIDGLYKLLDDEFPTVQIEAAKTLIKNGHLEALPAIVNHMSSIDYTALYAIRAFQEIAPLLDDIPLAVKDVYQRLVRETIDGTKRKAYYNWYGYWALKNVLEGEKYYSRNK